MSAQSVVTSSVKLFFAPIAWLIHNLWSLVHRSHVSRFKIEEVVIYSIPRPFLVWPLPVCGFILAAITKAWPQSAGVCGWLILIVGGVITMAILYDVNTYKALIWAGLALLVWFGLRYLEMLRHVIVLGHFFKYIQNLHPKLDVGSTIIASWITLGIVIGALIQAYCVGYTKFTPNSIEHWRFGEGTKIDDRAGTHFRSNYRDLLESFLTFGGGDLESIDADGRVKKTYENVMFLFYKWPKLDDIFGQRASVVDNTAAEPVEAEVVSNLQLTNK